MSIDVFYSVETVREFTKQSVYQVLDFKLESIPKFPFIFKDFPDSKKVNFGLKIGTAITFVCTLATQKEANPDIVNAGILEAMQDIHDDLKERYLKL